MRAGAGEPEAAGLSYGRKRLYGARAAENSSVRARSCRALAGAGGIGSQGVAEAGTAMAQGSGVVEAGRVNTK